jgi:hypothetical protein
MSEDVQIIEFDTVRLRSDGRHQWVVESKTVSEEGEISWSPDAYCRNLDVALTRLCRRELLAQQAESIEELQAKVEELAEKIEDAKDNVLSQIEEILSDE